jgi:hypothetical protein
MRPFRFRLDRVRAWQSMQARTEEEKLRAALADVARQDQRIDEFRASRGAAEAEICARPVLNAAELRGWAGFRRGMVKCEKDLLSERAAARTAADRQRDEFLNARRRLELIDKIRGRELAAWQAASDREIEEIAQESHLNAQHRERSA